MKTKLLIIGSSGFLEAGWPTTIKKNTTCYFLPTANSTSLMKRPSRHTWKNTVRRQLFIVQRSATPGIANNIPKTHTK